jgi:hypothetical protein
MGIASLSVTVFLAAILSGLPIGTDGVAISVTVETAGQGSDRIAGSPVVRTFEDGEAPLDPATDTGDPIASDTFTGRHVQVWP